MEKKTLAVLAVLGFLVLMIFFTAWAVRREQDIRSQAAPRYVPISPRVTTPPGRSIPLPPRYFE